MKIGAYAVLSELGRGGMGAVYCVRASDGREHALKAPVQVGRGGHDALRGERLLLASLGEETGG